MKAFQPFSGTGASHAQLLRPRYPNNCRTGLIESVSSPPAASVSTKSPWPFSSRQRLQQIYLRSPAHPP